MLTIIFAFTKHNKMSKSFFYKLFYVETNRVLIRKIFNMVKKKKRRRRRRRRRRCNDNGIFIFEKLLKKIVQVA